VSAQRIGIFLFDGAEELDWAGPWELLTAWSKQWPKDDVEVFTLAPRRCADHLRQRPARARRSHLCRCPKHGAPAIASQLQGSSPPGVRPEGRRGSQPPMPLLARRHVEECNRSTHVIFARACVYLEGLRAFWYVTRGLEWPSTVFAQTGYSRVYQAVCVAFR
jgi:hypothetical protein